MRLDLKTLLLASLLSSVATAIAVPVAAGGEVDLVARDGAIDARSEDVLFADVSDLWKRKGGGGGGGKGGGGSSSGGSSSGSGSGSGSSSGSSGSGSGSSSSGHGSSGSSSSSSSGKGAGSSVSTTGGRTKTGSGPAPAYGGGRYYGGGATVPYSAGGRSPSGISPFILGAGALTLFPALFLFGAFAYPYNHPYTFRNHTAPSNGTNTTDAAISARQTSSDQGVLQTKPVLCLCAQYAECGCDDTGNTTFLDQVIGNGSYAALNKSVVTVGDVNGTNTIVLNGTLPNGTTASGGTANANAAAGLQALLQASGWWVMIASVGLMVFWV